MSTTKIIDAPPALWRLERVLEMTGLGRSTIYRRIGTREFPAPRDLGGGPVAWRSDEIIAWIESRPVAAGHKVGHIINYSTLIK